VDDFPDFLTDPDAPMRHRIAAEVPEPVHTTLQRNGLADDPNIGLNSLRVRWVEEQFWVYRRQFPTPAAAGNTTAWLVFEHLEQDAIVFLNGQEVGRHSNAHRPARIDVTGKLNPYGPNHLVVRVDAGLYNVADKPGAEYQPQLSVLLNKRHWQRKGQWQAGWDWQQRVMNVGILGSARLEWADGPWMTDCTLRTELGRDNATAQFRAECDIHNPDTSPRLATIRMAIAGTDIVVEKPVEIPPGNSRQNVCATLDNPELWWPVGYGSPNRYKVVVSLAVAG